MRYDVFEGGSGTPLVLIHGFGSTAWLPGCGHNPMWDDPAGVAGAILDWPRSQPAIAA